MASRFWIKNTTGVTGNWNDTANWSDTSGGAGGFSVPTVGDTATLDLNGISGCVVDAAITCASITATSGYTGAGANDGHFDNATNNQNVTLTGALVFDNKQFSMGNGTWTFSGTSVDFDFLDVTTFAANSSTVLVTGTGISFRTGAGKILNNITIDTGATASNPSNNLNLSGNLIVRGTLTPTSTITVLGGDIQVTSTGAISGAGQLTVSDNTSISQKDGVISCTTMEVRGDHAAVGDMIIAGTYESAELKFTNTSAAARTQTWEAGNYVFNGNVTFEMTGGGNLTMTGVANNPNFTYKGSVTVTETSGAFSYTRGTGTITLSGAGSGTQNIDFDGKIMEAVVINDTGATKMLQENFTTRSLTLTAGTLNDNGKTITANTSTGFSIAAGATLISTGVFASSSAATSISNPTSTNRIATLRGSGLSGGYSLSGTTYIGHFDITSTSGGLDLSGNTIFSNGNWTISDSSYTMTTGTVNFDGTGSVDTVSDFETQSTLFHVTVSAGTRTLASNININGNLLIDGATAVLDVSASNFQVNVAGNITKSNGGTFTQRNGSVVVNGSGTSVIAGALTFYNFSCTTNNKTINFTAGETFRVQNSIICTSSIGSEITLQSTVSGTAWNLDLDSGFRFESIKVKDSNASTGITAVASNNSTNQGGNTNWLFGEGFSMIFDGVDDYIDVADHADLDLGSGNFSIFGWFKIDSTLAANGILLNKGGDGVVPRYQIAYITSTTGIQVATLDGAAQSVIDSTITGLNDNTWHFLLYYKNGNDFTLEIDNVVRGTETIVVGSSDNAGTLRLGQRSSGTASPLKGNLKTWGLVNSSINASVRPNLYKCSLSMNPNSIPGMPVFKMILPLGDKDSFPTASDRSGNGHNGTMTNMLATSIEADVPTPFPSCPVGSFIGANKFLTTVIL